MTQDPEAVRAYMRLAEQRIGAAFVADGLYCHMAGAWQGPHTLSYALRLYEPRAGNIAKALRLGAALEAAVGASPVRIYTDAGVIFAEIPSPWPSIVNGPQLRGQRLAVPLGLTPRKTIAGVDFEATPHLLAVGPTGRGKSCAMRGMAYHLARQNPAGRVAMLALTFKPDDWATVGALANGWAVITDPPEGAAALAWLRDKMKTRAKGGTAWPAIFAFVDDLAALLNAAPECEKPLQDLASMGRAAGIHLILGTQRLGQRGAGDALIASNIPDRLVFGTASANDAAFYTGRAGSGAERLGAYPGDALLISDGGAQRLAVGLVTDKDFTELRQHAGTLRPWVGTLVQDPPQPPTNGQNGGSKSGALVLTVQGAGLLTRPPTAEDAETLRALYGQLGSKNKVYDACKVAKNPLRAAWLAVALGE